MKKICLLLAMLLCVGLVSCTAEPGQNPGATTPEGSTEAATTAPEEVTTGDTKPNNKPDPAPTWKQYEQTVLLNSSTEGVKLLGERSAASASQLNCDWAGSGLEFSYNSRGGDVTLRVSTSDPCSFRVWVDGEAWRNTDESYFYTINGVRPLTISGLTEGEHTVRVIRVTEPELAQAHFFNVVFYGELNTAPAQNTDYIELVGGSAMLGFGLSGNQTLTADASQAYAYLTAAALGADYAITALTDAALAGKGGMAEAYLQSSPLREGTGAYDFARGADFVVLSLGEADFAASVSAEDFEKAYVDLIKTVYARNGEGCRIYCLYSDLDAAYAEAVKQAVTLLGGEAAGLYLPELTAFGAQPTAEEQAARAAALAAYITETKDQAITDTPGLPDGYLTEEALGGGIELDYTDGAWGA